MPGISSSADSKYITTYTGKTPHTRVFPSKHTSQQRRYNIAAMLWRCSDIVTMLWQRCVFAGFECDAEGCGFE